ncbi:unnamed protein product, partial [Mesorhabditis belari]|uniref:Uncharacterized protein n=1 Tax=Mesorhabditis belari TaxID=2138241 RepID=A0AAF3FBW2_9BILA
MKDSERRQSSSSESFKKRDNSQVPSTSGYGASTSYPEKILPAVTSAKESSLLQVRIGENNKREFHLRKPINIEANSPADDEKSYQLIRVKKLEGKLEELKARNELLENFMESKNQQVNATSVTLTKCKTVNVRLARKIIDIRTKMEVKDTIDYLLSSVTKSQNELSNKEWTKKYSEDVKETVVNFINQTSSLYKQEMEKLQRENEKLQGEIEEITRQRNMYYEELSTARRDIKILEESCIDKMHKQPSINVKTQTDACVENAASLASLNNGGFAEDDDIVFPEMTPASPLTPKSSPLNDADPFATLKFSMPPSNISIPLARTTPIAKVKRLEASTTKRPLGNNSSINFSSSVDSLNSLRTENSNLTSDNECLKSRIEILEVSQEMWKNRFKQLSSKTSIFESYFVLLTTCFGELEHLKKLLVERSKAFDQANCKLNLVEIESCRLRNELDKHNVEETQKRQRLEEQREDFLELQKKISKLDDELQKYKLEVGKVVILERKLKELQSLKSLSDEKVQSLNKDLQSAKVNVFSYKESFNEQKKMIENLQRQITAETEQKKRQSDELANEKLEHQNTKELLTKLSSATNTTNSTSFWSAELSSSVVSTSKTINVDKCSGCVANEKVLAEFRSYFSKESGSGCCNCDLLTIENRAASQVIERYKEISEATARSESSFNSKTPLGSYGPLGTNIRDLSDLRENEDRLKEKITQLNDHIASLTKHNTQDVTQTLRCLMLQRELKSMLRDEVASLGTKMAVNGLILSRGLGDGPPPKKRKI